MGESEFNLECHININEMIKWKDWFDTFCAKSGTSYNKSKADKVGTKKVAMSGQRKCIHNVKYKIVKSMASYEASSKGPGRKKGEDRVPGKQTYCPARISFQLLRIY